MLLKNAEFRASSGFALFRDMVNAGLYEFLMEEIPRLLLRDAAMRTLYARMKFPQLTRDFVKKLTMVALYSHPASTRKQSKFARHLFEHYFPDVMQLFAAIKEGDGKSYTRLPIILQRLESTLVLDRICKEFVQRYRQPVFTIHDGLVTTLPYLLKLKAIAEEVITKAVGVAPNLVEEHLSSDHLRGNAVDDMLERMVQKAGEPPLNVPHDIDSSAEYYCILVPYGEEYQNYE